VDEKISLYCDGGARGNPGPAAVGVVVRGQGHKLITRISRKIGRTTNNVAEYSAVLAGLEWVLENTKNADVEFCLDSELVVRQLKGVYKIKDVKLKELFSQVREKIMALGREPAFHHILRSKNSEADKLVNQALDGK
jgi:ribonuclease HI